MFKIIGGFVFSLLVLTIFATIDLWKYTKLEEVFTFILAAVFVAGSLFIGTHIAGWFEENDSTRSTDEN